MKGLELLNSKLCLWEDTRHYLSVIAFTAWILDPIEVRAVFVHSTKGECLSDTTQIKKCTNWIGMDICRRPFKDPKVVVLVCTNKRKEFESRFSINSAIHYSPYVNRGVTHPN